MNKVIQHPHFPTLLLLLAALAGINSLSWVGKAYTSFKQYRASRTQLAQLEQAETYLARQAAELAQLQTQARQLNASAIKLNHHLDFVEYLEKVCQQQRVKILSHPREQQQTLGNYTISDEYFSLQGRLPALLKTLYQLEYAGRVGSISYVALERELMGMGRKRRAVLLMHVNLKRM